MSNNKSFSVECDLSLRYVLKINAKDEDSAQERAEDRLKLIAETQVYKYEMVGHDTHVDGVKEVGR